MSQDQEKRVGGSTVSVAKSNATAAIDDPKAQSNGDYPEGGFAAWSTVAGAFLVQMCGFGYTTSFGVYQDYYGRVYLTNSSSSAISWIGSINALLVIASGVFAGRLFDRGYFYYILYGGSVLLTFCLFMLSLAKPNAYYQILLSQGVGVGLGAGVLYVPSVAIVSQYFNKRRALAMTIVASGSSLGAVLHPIMLNNTLNNPSIGFATAARANAGLVGGLMAIACLLMRTRDVPQGESINFLKAGKKFAKDVPYLFTAAGMAIFTMGFYFPLFYMQLDAVTHGLGETFSFYSLVIMNACSFFGRLAPGFVAHKFGVANMISTATFCCSVLILGMIGLSSLPSVVVIGVIYGFFAGVYVTLLGPILAVLSDNMAELGARMGVAFFFCGIGSLVGTPIDGALLTADYIWWRPALFSGIMAFAGNACFVTATILLRRRRNKALQEKKLNHMVSSDTLQAV